MNRARNVLLSINIMISVGLPIFLGYFTSISVEVSVLLGLAGLVLSLQVEMYLRADQRERAEDLRARLINTLSRDKDFGAQMITIIEGVGAVLSTAKHPAYLKIARDGFEHAINLIGGLQKESVELREVVPSLRESDSVSRSFKAVSMLDAEMAWWRSSDGKEWLAANQEWGKSKATIDRIFLYEDPWTEQKEAIVQEHLAHGVRAYKAKRQQITSDLRRNVAIFDDEFIMEFTGWGNPDTIERVVYCVERTRVQQAVRDFERLRKLAQPCASTPGGTQP